MVAVELTAGDSIDVAVTNTAGDTVSVTVTGHESYLGVNIMIQSIVCILLLLHLYKR